MPFMHIKTKIISSKCSVKLRSKQERYMKLSFTVSEKALEASYHVAKLIARQKNAYFGQKFIKTNIPGNCSINAWTKGS